MGGCEDLIESESIIVGQHNVRTAQETQEFLRTSEMGRLLGVAHLLQAASEVGEAEEVTR
jgi:hypothetical protein